MTKSLPGVRPGLALMLAISLVSALAFVLLTPSPAEAGPTGNCTGVKYSSFTFNFVNGISLSGDNCPDSDYEFTDGNGARKSNEAWFAGTGGASDYPNGLGMQIHVSCSDIFVDGWSQKGGPELGVDTNWQIANYTIDKYKADGTFNKTCGEVFVPTPGKIIVKKEVTAGSDTAQSFVFAASYDGDGFSLSHGQSNDSGDLSAGTYSVSETVPAGWTLQSAICDDQSNPSNISLQEGETVTCTFVNHIPDEVSPTSIVSTTTTIVSTTTTIVSTTVEVSDETLPFTGAESGPTAALALVLLAGGALALVGARSVRADTDE